RAAAHHEPGIAGIERLAGRTDKQTVREEQEDIMNGEFASRSLETLARVSAQAAVLVLLVLLAQWARRRWLSPRWRCALWLIVIGRLLLPVSLPTPVSLFNLVSASAKQDTSRADSNVSTGAGRPQSLSAPDPNMPPARACQRSVKHWKRRSPRPPTSSR